MLSAEIRESFMAFFREKGHRFVRSSSVVPHDDSTLLFCNAGMNQFKPIFLNQEKPSAARIVNSQKCIRVSGKHNDLEEVGVDNFHHTFFEMLGNWSFGDYYKKESIEWAWELLTKTWGLDKKRLWATVYKDDPEAYDIWIKVTDIAKDRILRFGEKENFWEMGSTGPCGPCSEIHYFVGENENQQDPKGVNKGSDYWELWNLVFIQNNRLPDGTLVDLPKKHIDTGAGLERISTILQGKKSNYDTDLFQPLIRKLESITNFSYEEKPIPFKVISDHIRMLTFSISDGAIPSNDGRGYVLRRILRRASKYGRSLKMSDPFLYELVSSVCSIMGDVYPEIVHKKSHVEKIIKSEEISFNKTLGRGIVQFEKIVANKKDNIISGGDAFRLYDTFGFPLDLTQLMARENEMSVDEHGFELAMDKQRSEARLKEKFTAANGEMLWNKHTRGSNSLFLGYGELSSKSTIRKYAIQDGKIFIVLDQTPFYAESGGQIGDSGIISGQGTALAVENVIIINKEIIHVCVGKLLLKETVICEVDEPKRFKIMKNHTSTHLLHKALKNVLGDHVHQAGSLVDSEYLRFDFTHSEKLTLQELETVESQVNEQILLNHKLKISEKDYDQAKNDGAEALFGEKYGDQVRVVEIDNYSMELCGGTHVNRTGDIGSFQITEETSLASGVRRILAVTGPVSVKRIQKRSEILNSLQRLLNVPEDGLFERVTSIVNEKKKLDKQLSKQKKNKGFQISSAEKLMKNYENYKYLTLDLENMSMEELKCIGDDFRQTVKSGIAVIFGQENKKLIAVVAITDNLVKKGIQAGKLAKEIGALMGGGGGGKPHLASAGGSNILELRAVIEEAELCIIKYLGRLT